MKQHVEIDLQRELLVEASRWKMVGLIWRQQSGLFFTQDGRPVRIGFPGLSDVGGILQGGQAFQLELKAPNGSVTREQQGWLKAVRDAGGRAGIVRSLGEAKEILEG
jgi:hypothetical protein